MEKEPVFNGNKVWEVVGTIAFLVALTWAIPKVWPSVNSSATWLWSNLGTTYLIVAMVIGALSAVGLFCYTWWYSASKYQFPGLALGWLPAGIIGFVALFLAGGLWPLTLLIIWITIYYHTLGR